jgi:hypothetical protein
MRALCVTHPCEVCPSVEWLQCTGNCDNLLEYIEYLKESNKLYRKYIEENYGTTRSRQVYIID